MGKHTNRGKNCGKEQLIPIYGNPATFFSQFFQQQIAPQITQACPPQIAQTQAQIWPTTAVGPTIVGQTTAVGPTATQVQQMAQAQMGGCVAQINSPPSMPPQIYMNPGLFINYTEDLLNSNWNIGNPCTFATFDTSLAIYSILTDGKYQLRADVTFSYGALAPSMASILIRNVDGTIYQTTNVPLSVTGSQNSKQLTAHVQTQCLSLKAGDKIRLSMGNAGQDPYLLQSVDPLTQFTLSSC